MSRLPVLGKTDEVEFIWGKKRGIGRAKKDVQFYESFVYDGIEYKLYDSVYMYTENSPEPYVGKIVKAWQDSDESKKVKIHWFFRPSEIAYYLRDKHVLENEIFLASGYGRGLANVNLLEAIAGKCHVVCLSKDSRNLQPTTEDLKIADYVFFRVFDVAHFTISDEIEDNVGGLEVKYVFNNNESLNSLKRNYPEPSSPQHNNETTIENANHMIERKDAHAKRLKRDNSLGDPYVDVGVGDREKSSRKNDLLGNAPAKSFTSVHRISSSEHINEIDSLDAHVVKRVKKEHTSSCQNLMTVKEETPSLQVYDNINASKNDELIKDFNISEGKLSSYVSSSTKECESSADRRCEELTIKNVPCREATSKNNGFMSCEETRSLENDASLGERPKSTPLGEKDLGFLDGIGLSILSSKTMKKGIGSSNGRPNGAFDNCQQNKDVGKHKESFIRRGDFTKNAKLEDYSKNLKNDKKNVSKNIDEIITKSQESLESDHDEKTNKVFNCMGKEDRKNVVKDFVVTKKPIVEKANWIKLPWEERIKAAQSDGKLVLLQNLDPRYTSAEVEDIIWHAFEEECSAKLVQHVTTFNPHYGQAFVIFKTRGAVNKVLIRLDERCLMLPNQRPLIARVGDLSKYFDNRKLFYGHLAFDKARRPTQMRDSVSTSHYSQCNTIEFEMAMAWRTLELKFEAGLKDLYEKQHDKLMKVRANLKVE